VHETTYETLPERIPSHPWKRKKTERLSNVARVCNIYHHTLDDTTVAVQRSTQYTTKPKKKLKHHIFDQNMMPEPHNQAPKGL
jgi:hypothetical protein